MGIPLKTIVYKSNIKKRLAIAPLFTTISSFIDIIAREIFMYSRNKFSTNTNHPHWHTIKLIINLRVVAN